MKNRKTTFDEGYYIKIKIIIFSITLYGMLINSLNVSAQERGGSNIIGTWSHCNKFDKTSTEFKWTFMGMKFVNVKGDYLNSDCSGAPNDGYSELYSGSYVIGQQAGSSSGMNTMQLNLTVKRTFGMPLPSYEFYTIYALEENVLYLGDTRTGPDGFSSGARPSSLQIDDGDYKRLKY